MKPTVLVDLTPLRADSGRRGIGRYISVLTQGIEDARADWQDTFDVVAVTHFGPRPTLRRDLAAAAADNLALGGTMGKGLAWQRRVSLPIAARAARADVVHVTEAWGTPLVLGAKRVVTCYDLIPLRFPKQYMRRFEPRAARWAVDLTRYRIADRVVAISPRTADDVVNLMRIPAERVDVARCGIDHDFWGKTPDASADDATLERFGIRAPFVVYIGSADFRKNVAGMFGAVKRARRDVPVSFVWAGQPTPSQRDKAIALAKAEGIGDAVKLIGFVPDDVLATLYRRAVAQLFLSRLEGFGLPIAEAMVTGCPSIVAAGSGSEDVSGDSGIVVGADDHDAAGAAIVALATDRSFREKLGAAGRARVVRYTRRAMATDYLASYAKAVGVPPPIVD